MPAKHPYIAATGSIGQVVAQLRKNFPTNVDAGTIKKFGIAPNNESYLINILRFIGLIGDGGERLEPAKAVFFKPGEEFGPAFGGLVENAYSDLFEIYGQDAWSLPTDKLVGFFRQADETSDVIGGRQAGAFAALARLAGKRDGASTPSIKKTSSKPVSKDNPKAKQSSKTAGSAAIKRQMPTQEYQQEGIGDKSGNVALTVRIEVNLPAGGGEATYDAIFKSIRTNLLP